MTRLLILMAALSGFAGAAAAQAPAAPPVSPSVGSATVPMLFNEVLARARINASLQLQVRLQLHRAQLKRDDVWCRASVLDSRWSHLTGERLGPYVCPIGRRTLVLAGTVTFLDSRSNKISPTDPDLPNKAYKMTETRFKWRWQGPEVGAK